MLNSLNTIPLPPPNIYSTAETFVLLVMTIIHTCALWATIMKTIPIKSNILLFIEKVRRTSMLSGCFC